MKKYPSIEQFRNIIKKVRLQHDYQGVENDEPVYHHKTPYPVLKFKGTVKLHGTNAAIVKYKDKIEYQSRERILTLNSDNAGFMLNMASKELDFLFEDIEFKEYIAIYGEWCGGNIQSGVALTQLPKMFVIFGYLVDDIWVDIFRHESKYYIYHIDQFPTYLVDIDFNQPELIQNKLIDLTLDVEKQCPVAKNFGIEGIGEGIVFTCVNNAELKFKSKGEKHSISKVKVLNSVNEEEINSINEFVDYSVSENRLKQGLDYLKEQDLELHQKNTGLFLSWIFKDIEKEEFDTIIKNQLDIKKINSVGAKKARTWFFNNI